MNKQDTFELIASDAVNLLIDVVQDLGASEDPADHMAALVIAAATETFCDRAIALGAS